MQLCSCSIWTCAHIKTKRRKENYGSHYLHLAASSKLSCYRHTLTTCQGSKIKCRESKHSLYQFPDVIPSWFESCNVTTHPQTVEVGKKLIISRSSVTLLSMLLLQLLSHTALSPYLGAFSAADSFLHQRTFAVTHLLIASPCTP